jgi:hypothetical protein
MTTLTVVGAGKMASLLLLVAGVMSGVSAQASVFPMDSVPDWELNSGMTLQIAAPDAVGALPLTYTVVPLTSSLGLNQTDRTRSVSREKRRTQLGNVQC